MMDDSVVGNSGDSVGLKINCAGLWLGFIQQQLLVEDSIIYVT